MLSDLQAILNKNDRGKPLTQQCKAALYRRALEDSEDIRFDYKLSTNCAADKMKFCPHVRPGRARVIHCLETHKDDPLFSGVLAALATDN